MMLFFAKFEFEGRKIKNLWKTNRLRAFIIIGFIITASYLSCRIGTKLGAWVLGPDRKRQSAGQAMKEAQRLLDNWGGKAGAKKGKGGRDTAGKRKKLTGSKSAKRVGRRKK